jgi:hypothetical protein
MSGCCSGSARVKVEAAFYMQDGETCDRCGDTREATRAAVAEATGLLSPMGVVVELAERELGRSEIARSNEVLVNGRPVEEWLGGAATENDCPSCAELIGEPTCCRAVEIDGVVSEALGRETIVGAIMIAAGHAPARPGLLAVTIVTGAGCG